MMKISDINPYTSDKSYGLKSDINYEGTLSKKDGQWLVNVYFFPKRIALKSIKCLNIEQIPFSIDLWNDLEITPDRLVGGFDFVGSGVKMHLQVLQPLFFDCKS